MQRNPQPPPLPEGRPAQRRPHWTHTRAQSSLTPASPSSGFQSRAVRDSFSNSPPPPPPPPLQVPHYSHAPGAAPVRPARHRQHQSFHEVSSGTHTQQRMYSSHTIRSHFGSPEPDVEEHLYFHPGAVHRGSFHSHHHSRTLSQAFSNVSVAGSVEGTAALSPPPPLPSSLGPDFHLLSPLHPLSPQRTAPSTPLSARRSLPSPVPEMIEPLEQPESTAAEELSPPMSARSWALLPEELEETIANASNLADDVFPEDCPEYWTRFKSGLRDAMAFREELMLQELLLTSELDNFDPKRFERYADLVESCCPRPLDSVAMSSRLQSKSPSQMDLAGTRSSQVLRSLATMRAPSFPSMDALAEGPTQTIASAPPEPIPEPADGVMIHDSLHAKEKEEEKEEDADKGSGEPPGPATASAAEADPMLDGSQLRELAMVLGKVEELQYQIQQSRDNWERSTRNCRSQIAGMQQRMESHLQSRADFVDRLRKLLAVRSSGTSQSKFQKLDAELMELKLELEVSRLDMEVGLRVHRLERQKMVISPLADMLQAYAEYFRQGYELLQPYAATTSALSDFTELQASAIRRQATAVRRQQAEWENLVMEELTPEPVDKSAQPSSRFSRLYRKAKAKLSGTPSKPQTPSSAESPGPQSPTKSNWDKAGFLYLPQPKFLPIWVQIREGTLVVRPMDFTLTRVYRSEDRYFPLKHCSVEPAPKAKLRFAFHLTTPTVKLLLQTETEEDYHDWLLALQTAIEAQQLEFQQSAQNASVAATSPEEAEVFDEDQLKILEQLWSTPGNTHCADCNAAKPTRAVQNLGILICTSCAIFHRSLGAHISKVRTVTPESMDRFALDFFRTIGNANCNAILEKELRRGQLQQEEKPKPDCSMAERERFVKNKYARKEFMENTWIEPEKVLRMMYDSVADDLPIELWQSIVLGADHTFQHPQEEGRTALAQAVMFGDPVMVEMLIQNIPPGKDILRQQELRGWTPLHYAAYQDDPELVELLLKRGGSSLILERDWDSNTPLDACGQFNEEPRSLHLLQAALEQVKSRRPSKS